MTQKKNNNNNNHMIFEVLRNYINKRDITLAI